MKKIYFSIIVLLFLASCGGEDKKAKLAELKKQHSELADQIKALEAELALSDTTKGKQKDILVEAILPQAFKHYVEIQGIVDADENVSIMPMMGGNITKIYVNEGDVVKVGQVLAEVDNEIYARQINSLQPQLALATDMFNRQQRLWDQKVGTEIQYLQAKTQKESIEKQIETLQEQLDMTRIKSPINGTVDLVNTKIGQFVAPGALPVFRVVNMSRLKVSANIAEAYAGSVKKGNEAVVYFPDLKREAASSISFVARVIDPLTRTFVTEATITGENSDLHPNMIAVLKVVDYAATDALLVPVNLIQKSEAQSFVFIAKEESGKKIARKMPVTVGYIFDGKAQITQGLNANDLLIVTGASDLADGLEIKY
jgi:RND family efflux transporter MFP subunit